MAKVIDKKYNPLCNIGDVVEKPFNCSLAGLKFNRSFVCHHPKKEGRTCGDGYIFPDWCPLPDAKEADDDTK